MSGSGSSFSDKMKSPFGEIREKLKDTHLHDFKIQLEHKKYVRPRLTTRARARLSISTDRLFLCFPLDTRLESSRTL